MKRWMMMLLVAMSAAGAMAQESEPSGKKLVSTTQLAEQKAKELKLDDQNTAWFVPLYAEYQDTLRHVRQSIKDGTDRGSAREMKKMDDAAIKRTILKNFDIEEQSLALKRIYFERFSEHLTAQQLMTVFRERPQGAQRGAQRSAAQGGFGGPGRGFGGPDGGFGGPGF